MKGEQKRTSGAEEAKNQQQPAAANEQTANMNVIGRLEDVLGNTKSRVTAWGSSRSPRHPNPFRWTLYKSTRCTRCARVALHCIVLHCVARSLPARLDLPRMVGTQPGSDGSKFDETRNRLTSPRLTSSPAQSYESHPVQIDSTPHTPEGKAERRRGKRARDACLSFMVFLYYFIPVGVIRQTFVNNATPYTAPTRFNESMVDARHLPSLAALRGRRFHPS
jgi:hypothetical protein